jgi:glycosyltransferase involved in cell wall biosynthesis
MGRPVVAPSHGAAPEILLPGATGWLFTPSNAPSLAGALEQAMNLPVERREELAVQARSHIIENFGRDSMTASTIDIYESLLAKHGSVSG